MKYLLWLLFVLPNAPQAYTGTLSNSADLRIACAAPLYLCAGAAQASMVGYAVQLHTDHIPQTKASNPVSAVSQSILNFFAPADIDDSPAATGVWAFASANSVLNAASCGSSTAPSWCSGSDLGAWINAAFAQFGASIPGTVVVPPGNYTLTTSISNNATAAGRKTLILYGGVLTSSASPVLSNSAGPMIIYGNNTRIHNTGTGHAIVMNGTSITNGMAGVGVYDLIVDGLAGSGDALHLTDIGRSTFANIQIPGTGAVGVDCFACISVEFEDLKVSSNLIASYGLSSIPNASAGVSLNQSIANTFTNPVLEVTNGTGASINNSSKSNVFIGGTIEGNTTGVVLGAGTSRSMFLQNDFEANTIDCTDHATVSAGYGYNVFENDGIVSVGGCTFDYPFQFTKTQVGDPRFEFENDDNTSGNTAGFRAGQENATGMGLNFAEMWEDQTGAAHFGNNGNGITLDGSGNATFVNKATASGYFSNGATFSVFGCSANSSTGGATAGSFAIGTTSACSATITMGGKISAVHGWTCTAYDITNVPTVAPRQTSYTTTTCVLSMTPASTSDVIVFSAIGW